MNSPAQRHYRVCSNVRCHLSRTNCAITVLRPCGSVGEGPLQQGVEAGAEWGAPQAVAELLGRRGGPCGGSIGFPEFRQFFLLLPAHSMLADYWMSASCVGMCDVGGSVAIHEATARVCPQRLLCMLCARARVDVCLRYYCNICFRHLQACSSYMTWTFY